MALADMLFGADNPFSQWKQQNPYTLPAIGAGIASGRNFGEGLSMAAQNAYSASPMNAQAQQTQAQKNITKSILGAKYPDLAQLAEVDPQGALQQFFRREELEKKGGDLTAEQRNYMFGQENPEFMDFLSGENRQNVSLTPQWAQDENGNWVMLQTSSTGDLVQSQIPDGLRLADPRLLNAEKAAGSQFGKDVAGAQFSLPRAELTRDQTLAAIEDIRAQTAGKKEQFGNIMGVPQQMTPALPGTEKAKFQVAVDRATNRAFLEAREMLKGGGQITDFESRKAEAAITAMQTAMERGDEAQFDKAVKDFEEAVRSGFQKLEQQAGMLPGVARQPVMAPTGGDVIDWTDL